MKKLIVLLMLLFSVGCLFALNSHTVPIDNQAYRIIEVAEIRGIISRQMDVKPYGVDLVCRLLSEIAEAEETKSSEKAFISELISSLIAAYGDSDSSISDLLRNGHYASTTDDGSSVRAGMFFNTTQRIGMDNDFEKSFDSRNSATAYIRGNLFNFVSFDINFKLLIDHLDSNSYALNEFTTDCEGFYMSLSNGGDPDLVVPFNGVGTGLGMNPELSTSLFDGKLSFRFASVSREWGPAIYNLGLSGSARAFDAFELSVQPTSWFSYSVMTGSLGKSNLSFADGRAWPSDPTMHTNKYDNNFSIHRIEITVLDNFRFSIYESCVWRKRFELMYLNPLAIYMFAQNSLGDFDNMLAGLDFSWRITGFGKVYGGLAIDEMNSKNPRTLLTFARNILALQGGAVIPVNIGLYGSMTFQATYIPPFFGSHYDYYGYENPWGDDDFATNYVNKGQSLSYPSNPDTLEFMLRFETGLDGGWEVEAVFKDQLSSAQYATEETNGLSILDTMWYGSDYDNKNLFANIWKNELNIDLQVSKQFDDCPVKVICGIQYILDFSREYYVDSSRLITDTHDGNATTKHNTGNACSYGNWKNLNQRVIGRIGVSIYN